MSMGGVRFLRRVRGREATSTSTPWLFIKTLIQSSILWFVFLLILPLVIFRLEDLLELDRFRFGNPNLKAISVLLFVTASGLAIASYVVMVLKGRGTPAPFDCPSKLVVEGPYRYVRNPMAVSGIIQGISVALFLGSPLVLIYVGAGLVIAETIIRPWEEDDLERRFGQAYVTYRNSVRRWFPR